jgi:WD40 repeat protein
MQLSGVVLLTILAGTFPPSAQTANQTPARNGQTAGQTQKQDAPALSAPAEAQAKKEAVLSRHDDVIPGLAFSPDGKRLASAGDNSVKVTELETGKELLRLKSSRGMHFFSLAYSPDGKTMAGAQSMLKERSSRRTGDTTITTFIYFGEVLVWDAETGAVKVKLNDDDNPAWALAFSPDGRWLAVATGPIPEDRDCANNCPAFGEITVWDTGSWKRVRQLRGGSAPFRSLAYSPDGRWIAGGSGLMDGGRGASAEEDSSFEIFLWEAASGDLKQKLSGHTRSVTSLAFSPDSRLLASAGLDRMMKIWDCRTYEMKKMASDQMLSVDEMQTISDATGGKSGKNAMPPVSWLNVVLFSPDGKQIIGGSADSIVRFYENGSAKLSGVLKPRGWPFYNMAMGSYNPIGESEPRPSISGGGTLRPPMGRRGGMPVVRLSRWPYHPGSLNSMALSPDGKTLAIGNVDGKIRLLALK